MERIEFTIDAQGGVRAIYSDALAPLMELGQAEVKRASHVEPGEGGWIADLSPVGGPCLPATKLRAEALAREVEWLRENYL